MSVSTIRTFIQEFASMKVYVLLTLLLCFIMRMVYLVWLHPLANIPGPRIAALTDLWKLHAAYNGRYSSALHEQHVKHGNIVRIGPNEVSVIAPKDVKTMYGHKTEYLKGPFYNAFSVGGPSLVSERDPVSHAIRRNAVASAYSLKHLITLEQFCDASTELLLRILDIAAKSASPVDFTKLMDWYAYDTVSGIAFGKSFGFLENGADEAGLLPKLANTTRTIFAAGTSSNFGWILPTKIGSLIASLINGGDGLNFVVGYGSKIVRDRRIFRETDRITYEERKDMLYRFIEATHSATSELTNPHSESVLRNTLSIMFAGADTTKISMIAFLRYVYSHPPTIMRLRKEIDEAIDSGHVSFPISYGQATRLEFLSACMKEAMRLHPAIGMTLQRVVPDGGRVIGGHFFREGTLIGMSPREIHYSARAYGKDASKWRPERWLDGDRNALERVNLVFGQGSRVCVGKNISIMEMSKLLPTIVYHYDIVIRNKEEPWKVHESWFVNQYDFICSVVKRDRETSD